MTVYVSVAWTYYFCRKLLTYLGVILYTEISMVQHVRGVTSRCFYQLRQIRAIRKSRTAETSQLLVHAFINSRLLQQHSVRCWSGASPKTAVHSKCGCTGCRAKTKIRPNHLNTSRRFALAACGITNPFQAMHACVQESSCDCSGIYRREVYPTLI